VTLPAKVQRTFECILKHAFFAAILAHYLTYLAKKEVIQKKMKKGFFCVLLCCTFTVQAQVGIGTTSPQGALDIVSSNDTGVVIPRVSSIDNVTDGQGNPPENGTLVYDLSKNAICFFMNQKWVCMEFNDLDGSVGAINNSIPYDTQDIYIKASNTGNNDEFGASIIISEDGNTLAISAPDEDSNTTGINGDQTDNSASNSGAVYVFTRSSGTWSQQAYIKASNSAANDTFGETLSLSADGNTLAVGADGEDSNATGVNGDQTDNSANFSGAAYVFTRSANTWSQEAYIKASNTGNADFFGRSLALSADGNTLAVGASGEDSNATGINGNQADNSLTSSGATYVFTRTGSTWSQEAYIKASNTDNDDHFGEELGLSGDGNTLTVIASREDSNATGINGDQTNNFASFSGAAYVFTRAGSAWSQQAYIKASNSAANDRFGTALDLSSDGNTMVIGALGEDSNALGVNGDQTNNTSTSSGASYVFVRAGIVWSQEAYIKAFNTDDVDYFGSEIALNSDGNTLVVSAIREASNAVGIEGDQADNSSPLSGAVYAYSRSGSTWSRLAYIKATNTDSSDQFGHAVALSGNGDTLIVGADFEDSNATGINGDQTNNSAGSSGAAYIYEN